MNEMFLDNLKAVDLYNQTVVIGVSTGVDSMALLNMYYQIKDHYRLKIVCAHVNHKKRIQYEEEEKYIIDYCHKKDIPIEVLHLNLDLICDNFQSEARSKRYEFYLDVAKKHNAKYISLAHHALDNMETILMRLSRGSSLRGYAGMAIITDYRGKKILRPLLTYTKDELYEYAKTNNIKYFEDESNQSDDYTRNRYRKHIIKEILNESSNAYLKYLEFSQVLLDANSCLNRYRDEFINQKITYNNEGLEFSIIEFNKLDPYLQTEVLFEILKDLDLSKTNIEEILKIINSEKANVISDIRNIKSIVKEYDKITILNHLYQKEEIDVIIDKEGIYQVNDIMKIFVEKKESNYITNNDELWYNTNMFPCHMRTRRDGDRIYLNGSYKKVKDLLIDKKVGVLSRDKVLVLENNLHEIVWVVGYAKSAHLLKDDGDSYLIKIQRGDLK